MTAKMQDYNRAHVLAAMAKIREAETDMIRALNDEGRIKPDAKHRMAKLMAQATKEVETLRIPARARG